VRKWERERDAVQSSMSTAQQTAARCTVVKRLENRRSPKGDVNLAVSEGGSSQRDPRASKLIACSVFQAKPEMVSQARLYLSASVMVLFFIPPLSIIIYIYPCLPW